MRIPLTPYGFPQVVVWPILTASVMVVFSWAAGRSAPMWLVFSLNGVLAAVLVWALSFFRDPERVCPEGPGLILAPADGRVTDITVVDEPEFIGGRALRIGIFLSIFNVHINRSPCRAQVQRIQYRPGEFRNAMDPQSGRVNESNDLHLAQVDPPGDRLIVRQISGAIARRIVCRASPGQVLSRGERFGMIKFGSRTELYVPSRPDVQCLVQVKQPVRAGLTALVRVQPCPE